MSSIATLQNKHGHVGCVFIFALDWPFIEGGMALAKFPIHLLHHFRFPEGFESNDSYLTLILINEATKIVYLQKKG